MNDELNRRLQRWREADETGRDDDADAACRGFFAVTGRDPAPSVDFASRTLAAIAEATAADARRARRARRATIGGAVAAGVAALYFGSGWLVWAFSAALIGVIELAVGITVQVANGMDAGLSVWSVMSGIGRVAAALVSDPTVTVVIVATQGIAMAALIALQRLLGSDRESLK